jgi:lipopolysaccharide transport system ATP-binding protein
MTELAIRVENISKLYRIGKRVNGTLIESIKNSFSSGNRLSDFWALKDVTFDVKKGDAVGILGKNGAGKSTILKILSRITEPSTGRIDLHGKVSSLLEVGTGFHPELTGRENIYLNGTILGMRRSEVKAKFDDIVEFSGVEKFIDTPVKHYSSGMYVRLAFAIAAHLEPEILIVDEVLAVGDSEFQKKCIGKMDEVTRKEGRTILFVSHQIGAIAQLCNKGILFDKGQIIKQGSINEVIDRYFVVGRNIDYTIYKCKEESAHGKEMFFEEVCPVNEGGEEKAEFGFHESIYLRMKIKVKNYHPNIKISCALLDKYQNRVFTSLNDLNLDNLNEKCETITKVVRLPKNLIAPNNYSFHFSLFTLHEIYDIQEGECPIKVTDTGTDLADLEGINYGNIIIDCHWK